MFTNTLAITLRDREMLEVLKPIVDGIAVMLGPSCEVVLHSFENLDKSIIYVVNGHITGRSIGSPITDLGMKRLKESVGTDNDVMGCYYSKTIDGKTLRSVTVLIRNAEKKPIGMLCINFNLSAPLLEVLNIFHEPIINDSPENFVDNIDDLVKNILSDTIRATNSSSSIPNHDKNRTIVYELCQKGIFDIRGAVDIVARELSLSRYTVYSYIRDNKS